VELCENMPEGGCTPSAGTILMAKKHLQIPVFVMIRPRGADFLYSDEEFAIMQTDILKAKEYRADGVVFGILKPDGTIDIDRMQMLLNLSRPMGVTCHRAFDMTRDPFEALETLMQIGIDRVLTSGQSDSALEGAPLIRQLIVKAAGRIIVMPGHGVKEHNLEQVIRGTGADEYHMYLTKLVPTGMQFIREDVKMGKPDLPEYGTTFVDAERIRIAKEIIANY
jgi:copper homeostasis protein